MRTVVCLLMLALLSAFCAARETTQTYELNLTGTLEIGPDGLVRSYELESRQSAAIATLVKSAVSRWRFAPILDAGKPVIGRTQMELELEAVPVNDKYSLEVRQVTFGQPRRIADGPLPEYPYAAAREHLGAKVMLALQLDDRGGVAKAAVLQTSLGATTTATTTDTPVADQWRHMFEQKALDAVRHWQYDLTEIVGGKRVGIQVLQPIAFNMHGTNQQWNAFVPGPTHQIPWLHESIAKAAYASSTHSDEAVAMDSQFKLKSDVIGKTL